MGKASKWIKNFLTGKKETEKKKNNVNHHQSNSSCTTTATTENPTTPIAILQTTPKEKRRWSFRRSSATAPGQKDTNSSETMVTVPPLESENDQKKHALAVAAATAAAVAVKAAAAVIQLTAVASGRATAIEESAAIKIQSIFRGYLARKALNALKGLVKLQALVRGHLVRKQATATLRCMQALVTVQARARAQRIQMAQQDAIFNNPQKQFNHRKSTQENMFWNPNQDFDIGMKENIKIVEVDAGESKGSTKSRRNSYSNNGQTEKMEQWDLTPRSAFSKQDLSPAPSAITDQLSPKACSGHFEEYSSFGTAQSSPQQYYTAISKPDPARVAISYARSEYGGGGGEGDSIYHEYPFYPNYMANTESSKAKVRSHSAPKQRPVESIERQPSTTRRRPSIEGRNVPRAVRMQRSSSHVGSAAQNYQYPWSIKLDRSNISIKDSECGSSSTVLTTNTNYCRSLVGFDVQGSRY